MQFELENRESKWNEALATLNSKVPFIVTTDIKNLLRLGIPISQRVNYLSFLKSIDPGAYFKAHFSHLL